MKRLLTALVATIVALVSTGTPAAADPIQWSYAPCIQPYFSEFNWDTSGRLLVLDGGAAQCGPTMDRGGFRLATYHADDATGSAPGYNVRLFGSSVEGTYRNFGAVVVPHNVADRYGVCFLAGDEQRVMCGLVTVYPATATRRASAGIAPLAVDDPLVAKPVVATAFTGPLAPPGNPHGPVGNCGTCF